MRYLSLFSGVEAASVAWKSLGWTPVAFSEVEPFASSVLAHHYPGVPNLGDVTRFRDWPKMDVDLVVGGSPCQSFSVAGLRRGLSDPRGNLALTYLAVVDRYRPRWFVWENVPGVLSSWTATDSLDDLPDGEWEVEETSDFGCFLEGARQLGYGLAYRVLDAQYVRVDGYARAVPQRRRRVFVVGRAAADWRRAGAVLLDSASLRGDPPPQRVSRQGLPGSPPRGPEGRCCSVAAPLTRGAESAGRGGPAGRRQEDDYNIVAFNKTGFGEWRESNTSSTLRTSGGIYESNVIAFDARQRDVCVYGDVVTPLDTDSYTQALAFDLRGRDGGAQFEGPHETANIRAASGGSSRSYLLQPAQSRWCVRRITPIEAERLQGFPDGYTDIPWRGRRASDNKRYQVLGNSMAVNVMRWIGRRIERFDLTPDAEVEDYLLRVLGVPRGTVDF